MLQFRSVALFLVLQFAKFSAAATPLPISINFGSDFFGTDGRWSAAQIRVGTPEQYLWVYPNTVSSETWVVGPGGCRDLTCQRLRGGIFTPNASSSYTSLGRYDLEYAGNDLVTPFADYGLDNLTLSDSATAPAQVIGTVNDTAIWLGQLGLSVQEARFEGRVDHLSLIATLVRNESAIPSHSYSYTAGAHYKQKNVPGSLVLGGTDTTRYTQAKTAFGLSTGYIPKVAIQGITVSSSQSEGLAAMPSNWNNTPLQLMSQSEAALFTIDTSTPYMWMPPAVCDFFASALNLTYDDKLDLYVFPNSTNSTSSPQALEDWGLTFLFTIANTIDATTHVEIPITYNAFNLQLSYGYPNLTINNGDPAVNYFPLRRANSADQYIIGRAFLQETYLIVDYERNQFSISPAVFPDTSTVVPQIEPISRDPSSQWPGPAAAGSSSLSAGAKAGIGVGVSLTVVTLLAVGFLLFRRRRSVQGEKGETSSRKWWKISSRTSVAPANPAAPVAELLADRRHPRELLVDSSNTRFELPGNAPIEMPAADVPEAFLTANQGSDTAPTTINETTEVVEGAVAPRRSIRKDYNIRASVSERAPSPAPPYSPSQIGRNTNADSNTNTNTSSGSEGISPYDSRFSRAFGSHTSSGAAISPIAQYGTHSHSGENNSPVSPQMHGSQTMSSGGLSNGTHNSSPDATLEVPDGTVSRTTSRNSRFREEIVENTTPLSETQGERQQLRPRFSWEE